MIRISDLLQTCFRLRPLFPSGGRHFKINCRTTSSQDMAICFHLKNFWDNIQLPQCDCTLTDLISTRTSITGQKSIVAIGMALSTAAFHLLWSPTIGHYIRVSPTCEKADITGQKIVNTDKHWLPMESFYLLWSHSDVDDTSSESRRASNDVWASPANFWQCAGRRLLARCYMALFARILL